MNFMKLSWKSQTFHSQPQLVGRIEALLTFLMQEVYFEPCQLSIAKVVKGF